MNKRLLLTFLIAITILLSVTAISASEVNVTDSYTTNLVDNMTDVSVPMENAADSSVLSVVSDSKVDNDSSKVSLSSEEVLESENSNTLSTNSDSNNLSGDSENVINHAAYSDEAVLGAASDSITSKDLTKYYKGSEQYTATFFDANGNALKNTDIKLTINGKTYTVQTDSKGVASLAINLRPGTYSITATNPKTSYSLINTVKVLSTISSADVNKYYKGSSQYSATFRDTTGVLLKNTDVKISVNGKTYTVQTNSNGVASLAINLKPGNYSIVSTNPKNGETLTNAIKVSSTIEASDITKVYTDGRLFSATFLDSNGKPLSGKDVQFRINGQTYTRTTDTKGVATLSLTTLNVGTYKIVSYNVDGLTLTNNVKVIASTSSKLITSTYTFATSDTKVIKVTLLNGLGYAPGAGKVITFKVNGRSYTSNTNANGVASLTLPSLSAGTYTVEYSFAGNSFYTPSSASDKVYIMASSTPTITVKSSTTFTYGAGTSFEVALMSGNTPLVGKTVTFKVNGVSYAKTTNSNGIASLPINLAAGNYTISYTSTADSQFKSVSGSSNIQVLKKTYEGYGYWLFGGDMKNVNLNTLASQGTTDIFLNYYALEAHGQSAVESWIASANKVGIRVHIWMQSFYDGSWINPIKDGSIDTAYFNQKIAEAQKYAKIKGISGVHLDYLRYPGTAEKTSGGTNAITSFAKQISDAVHKINKNLIVSCALMPETTNNIKAYGQDLSAISKYVDLVVPMIYKGNYKKTTSWITTTTKWFVDNSKGAAVWTGLQGYKSDDDVTKLSTSEITNDAKAAVNANANGVMIFRWGVTNFVNFDSLNDTTPSGSVSIADILTAASELKDTIASNKVLPASVKVGGTSYTTPQFLYMMAKAIELISQGKTSTAIAPIAVKDASNPSSTAKEGTLTLAQYTDLATRVANFIVNNGQAPNYASSDLGNIQHKSLVDAFSRILHFYKTNNVLPNSVKINPDFKPSNSTGDVISVADIISGANTVKTYYAANKKLPSSITAGGIKFTMPEFMYLMSQAINQLGSSDKTSIMIIKGVTAPTSTSGDSINANLYKADYLVVAKDVVNYIKSNKQVPSYGSSSLGKISYPVLADAFSRILVFDGTNGILPNYAAINSGSTPSNTTVKVSIANIISASNSLKSYYASNEELPNTVNVGGTTFTMPEFLYLMSQAIHQLGSSNKNDIVAMLGIEAASNPSGDSIKSNLNKADYLTVANNIVNFIKSNNLAPNYASSAVGKLSYPIVSDAFARILVFYGTNDMLPNYVTISSSSGSSSATGTGLNEKNTITNLAPYLKSSTNCQVNNSAIKKVVDSLTSGLTTDLAKAQAIYNYVRDSISYSFYYDTKYGAAGTLTAKTGNCVDQAHLLVAMYRTAGLPARYVHGTCRFTSATYGHVWTQVLIGDTWRVGDPTSNRNSFGNVVNWNTNSFTLHGIYSGISF